MVFTNDQERYTHYTKFNESLTNLTFSIKLWDTDDVFNAHAKLLLALFALPLSPDEIEEMKIGLEIFISNEKSAMTIGNKDVVDYESSLNVLTSTNFTTFSLLWDSGFVTLNVEGKNAPIFLAEYNHKENLFGVYPNSFLYYSLMGTNVLWALPLCDEDSECEVHLTTTENYERFWPLRQTDVGHDLAFNVRAIHSASILMQTSPTVEFPKVVIKFSESDNRTKIIAQEYSDSAEIFVYQLETPKLLNYWEWHELSLSILGKVLNC